MKRRAPFSLKGSHNRPFLAQQVLTTGKCRLVAKTESVDGAGRRRRSEGLLCVALQCADGCVILGRENERCLLEKMRGEAHGFM